MRGGLDTRRLKKILLSLMVVGGLSFFTISFAYATLNAESTTTGNSISVGTLTLSDTVGASTCLSYGGPASPANHNQSCVAMFSSSPLMYPGSTSTVKVTVTNSGSLDANLSLFMPSCVSGTSPSAPSGVGGANFCTASDPTFYVDETSANGSAHSCVWPTTGGTCGNTAGTFAYMAGAATAESTAISLGSLNHNSTRYFFIGISLPSTASNAIQGEAGTFSLTWRLS